MINSVVNKRRVFVVMGVSGSGKSVIAAEVARRLGAAFLDGDYLHPRANIEKMSAGQSLNDDDRGPWLTALNDAIFAMQRTNESSFLVCSALKRRYRDRLREGNSDLYFIYLQGDFPLIEARMLARKGHFFKSEMLMTQFAALEEPLATESDVITISIDQTMEAVVEEVLAQIALLS
jgi:gluconokinase